MKGVASHWPEGSTYKEAVTKSAIVYHILVNVRVLDVAKGMTVPENTVRKF